MALTEYYIDGVPLPLPSGGVKLRRSDLESGESGLDESGFYHKDVLRQGLGRWELSYRDLTPGAYAGLLALLPKQSTFLFSHGEQTTQCCMEDVTAKCRRSLQGDVYDLQLTVAEC